MFVQNTVEKIKKLYRLHENENLHEKRKKALDKKQKIR